MNVGLGLPGYSVRFSSLEQSKAVLSGGHHVLALSLYEYTCILVFAYVQCLGLLTILEEIEKFLIVDLQERAVNCVSHLVPNHDLLEAVEQVLNRPRDDAKLALVRQERITLAIVLGIEAGG